MSSDGLATRHPQRLLPDPTRVLARLFVPGHSLPGGPEGRASGVVDHVLGLTDEEVTASLASVRERFGPRHRDLDALLQDHAGRISNRIDPDLAVSDERCLLLGATFTQELSFETAALCNPSAVAAPDQSGVPHGSLRFVMSVRQIGEGHRSTIGFRTGVIDEQGGVGTDAPSPYATVGAIGTSTLDADAFWALAGELPEDAEATRWVLGRLGPRFSMEELEARLVKLEDQGDTRRNAHRTVERLRRLAARHYTARFPSTIEASERVLHPMTDAESAGMEDARFVRFVDDEGDATYYATYTAYDGRAATQQLLATTDFATFTSAPLIGAIALDKGSALFPRRIDGRYATLARHDRSRVSIAFSQSIRNWPSATSYDFEPEPWETVQVGNCGPPIETDEGWLVLTHGVGPMRTYSMGAWLLDLDDPSQVIGRLRQPLLTPDHSERDGYVPNVIYSCGSLLHAGHLVIPFGVSDASIRFATVPLADLLAALRSEKATTPAVALNA